MPLADRHTAPASAQNSDSAIIISKDIVKGKCEILNSHFASGKQFAQKGKGQNRKSLVLFDRIYKILVYLMLLSVSVKARFIV